MKKYYCKICKRELELGYLLSSIPILKCVFCNRVLNSE